MKRSLSLCLLLVAASSAVAAEPHTRWVRYPAISPDGKQIAFSYQGDLWLVPSAGGKAALYEKYTYNESSSPKIIAANASIRAFSPRSLGSRRMITAVTIGDNAIMDKKGNSISLFPKKCPRIHMNTCLRL